MAQSIDDEKNRMEHEEKGRFYNLPDANADFNYWGKQAYWSIDEAIALILGKNPKKVKWDEIKKFSLSSPFVRNFEQILELAKRYVDNNQLTNPVTPSNFLSWAKRLEIQIPCDLLEAVNNLGIQIADWQSLYKQAIQLIDEKNNEIKLLQNQIEDIKKRNVDLNENNKLHPEDDHYSNELDTANIVYRAVINNRNKQQTFKEQAKALLDANHSTLSQDAKQRIIVLINPDINKLGGRKKSQP